MARVVLTLQFGNPDLLVVEHADEPQPDAHEVRVRVHRAGLNPVDWKILRGGPVAARYNAVPPCGVGNDFSGTIDRVGEAVHDFAPGDAVFGGCRLHAQADWLVIDPARLVRKPAALGFDEAGALDIAGRTAWATVRSLALTPEDTVLVSAAAGGVGVLAAQLARRTGATVVGTAGPDNHAFLRELGVLPVAYGEGLVDRLREAAPRYTAALDNNGPVTIDAALKLGVPGPRINTIAARGHRAETGITGVGGQEAGLDDLRALADLVAVGEVLLPIDSTFALDEVRAAYDHLMAGHLRGKVVLRVSEPG